MVPCSSFVILLPMKTKLFFSQALPQAKLLHILEDGLIVADGAGDDVIDVDEQCNDRIVVVLVEEEARVEAVSNPA